MNTHSIAKTLFCILLLLNVFTPVAAQESNEVTDDAELIFLVQVEDLELGDLLAIQIGDKSYISMNDFVSVLDLPFVLEEGVLSGWYRAESNIVAIYPSQAQVGWYKVVFNNNQIIADINDVAFIDNDYFVNQTLVERIFGLKLDVDVRDLRIVVNSSIPIPLVEKLNRKKKISDFTRSDRGGNQPQLPFQESEFALFDKPFMDFQANVNSNSTVTRGNISALANGDLFYMTGDYYIAANDDEGLTSVRLNLNREDSNGELLGPLNATRLSIGDISNVSVRGQRNSSNDVGVRISNAPLFRLSDFDTRDFRGLSQPGWDIELYHNGVLIDALSVESDGEYEFLEVPLYYGSNNFELRFFGPQGQRKSEFQQYNVTTPQNIREGWQYDISLTQQNSSIFQLNSNDELPKDLQLGLNIQKGITDNIIFSTGLTTVTLEDEQRHKLVPIHFDWFLEEGLFSFDAVKDLDGGERYRVNLNHPIGKHGIRMEYTHYDDFAADIDQNNNQQYRGQIRMSGPLLSVGKVQSSYSLNIGQTKSENDTITDTFGFNTSVYAAGLSMSNSINLVEIDSPLIFGTSKFGNGIFQLDKNFGEFNWRSRIAYLLEPESRISTYSNSLLWNYSDELSSEFVYNYSPQLDQHSGSVLVNWETDYATLGFNLGVDTSGDVSGALTVRFSMGHDPIADSYQFVNKRLAATGGVSALLFEDLNNNGVFDADERPIQNASVKAIQGKGNAITDEDGIAFITGLTKNRLTDVTLDVGSLEDPFWIPTNEGISMLPRPGTVQTLQIPVVTGGEIEGVVYFSSSDGTRREGSYAQVELLNEEGIVVDSVISGFDGFYLFTQIIPGRYQIRIAESDLSPRNLKHMSVVDVDIDATNNLVVGANLIAIPDTGTQVANNWRIEVGQYRSKTIASVVSLSIRNLLMKQQHKDAMTLHFQDGFYSFRSLGSYNRDTALNLCNVLKSNQIYCQILES